MKVLLLMSVFYITVNFFLLISLLSADNESGIAGIFFHLENMIIYSWCQKWGHLFILLLICTLFPCSKSIITDSEGRLTITEGGKIVIIRTQ